MIYLISIWCIAHENIDCNASLMKNIQYYRPIKNVWCHYKKWLVYE
jgi:hypothetical protein